MSRSMLIEAIVALVLWSLIFLLYFRRDIRRWFVSRPARRAARREQLAAVAAARTRAADELAAKYPVPGSPNVPVE